MSSKLTSKYTDSLLVDSQNDSNQKKIILNCKINISEANKFHLTSIDSNPDTDAGLITLNDKNMYKITMKNIDKEISVREKMLDNSTNTKLVHKINKSTQYEFRFLEPSDLSEIEMNLENLSFNEAMINNALIENDIYDFYYDDYGNMNEAMSQILHEFDTTVHEYGSISSPSYTRQKHVSQCEYHPEYPGVIAISYSQNCSHPEYLEKMKKFPLPISQILFWTIESPLKPLLILESRYDIVIFSINPSSPNIVAGGLNNGAIVLWDTTNYKQYLSEQIDKNKTLQASLKFNHNTMDIPTLLTLCYPTYKNQHFSSITDLKWIQPIDRPSHYENRVSFISSGSKYEKIMAISMDGKLSIWDIRFIYYLEETTDQVKSSKFMTSLNEKWRPLFIYTVINEQNFNVPLTKLAFDSYASEIYEFPELRRKSLVKLFAGTMMGNIVEINIVKDAAKDDCLRSEVPMTYGSHLGPVVCCQRCPFLPNLILSAGGYTWNIWREGFDKSPIYISSPYQMLLMDGYVDAFDLNQRHYEPIHSFNTSLLHPSTMSLFNYNDIQLLIVGNSNGVCNFYKLPKSLSVPFISLVHEIRILNSLMEQEVIRNEFCHDRLTDLKTPTLKSEAENSISVHKKTPETDDSSNQNDELMKQMKKDYEKFLAKEEAFKKSLGLQTIAIEKREQEQDS